MVGDRDFSSSSLLGMRSKGVADDTLVAADLSPWRNDHKGIRMSFLDSRIDIGAIISAITQEHANRAMHLIEQRCNVRAAVDVTTGQRASDNLARDFVQADMQFVP